MRITFTANLDILGRVQTRTTINLFEDTVCFATDLDGTASRTAPSVGSTTSIPMFRVVNADPNEYDAAERQALDCDYAELNVTFTDF